MGPVPTMGANDVHEHERLTLLAGVPDLTVRSLILDLHTRLDNIEGESHGVISLMNFLKWAAPLLVAIAAIALRG